MLQLTVLLKAMQIFTHSSHLLCARVVFFQDHEFFGELYETFEEMYDSVAERMIGLGKEEELDLTKFLSMVSSKLSGAPSTKVKENKDYYVFLHKQACECCDLIEKIVKEQSTTEGTKQLVGDIADQLEKIKYKISRRIK